ncbi:hypothetical protein IV203_024654 [Nitzschia inconspicua]|uniref:Integrase catalytic domain-containing protein n=1 Tax=Nitzschia inconspicua TaxID=303405 RepID=A0A9K3KAI9_9STRA|nr:hypothetical protein IV203_024654 [Nitzschia inconspicua]
MQPLTNLKQLRSFLGLVTFYRDMWPHRSHTLAPLTNILESKTFFFWNPPQQQAFEKMKAIVARDALLIYPDNALPFDVETDASEYKLGSMIKQNGRPIAYYSASMKHICILFILKGFPFIKIVTAGCKVWLILEEITIANHMGRGPLSPTIKKTVQKIVLSCDVCQRNKRGSQPYGHLAPRDAVLLQWQEIHCTAREAADVVEDNWIARYPRPVRCITDNGPEFGQEFRDRLEHDLGVKVRSSTSPKPQGNSINEQVHQSIG